jgi:hypothetical protein
MELDWQVCITILKIFNLDQTYCSSYYDTVKDNLLTVKDNCIRIYIFKIIMKAYYKTKITKILLLL